jgi:hypothetical protein
VSVGETHDDEEVVLVTIYRPGERVPVSGQYGVVNSAGGYLGREVTCVKGEPFPPLRGYPEHGYRLRDATRH